MYKKDFVHPYTPIYFDLLRFTYYIIIHIYKMPPKSPKHTTTDTDTDNPFYNITPHDKAIITDNINKYTLEHWLIISRPLALSIDPSSVHNKVIRDTKPQLLSLTVNSYIHLLKHLFPHHIFLTSSYIETYNNKEGKLPIQNLITTLNSVGLGKERKTHRPYQSVPLISSTASDLLDQIINTIETYYNNPTPQGSNKPLIFFPIYLPINTKSVEPNHFALAVLDIHNMSITYYDSLLNDNAEKYLNLIVDLITDYFFYRDIIKQKDDTEKLLNAFEIKDASINTLLTSYKDLIKQIKFKQPKLSKYTSDHPNTLRFCENIDKLNLIQYDMPQQTNNVDCGVYTCATAYIIANNMTIPHSFTIQQLLNIRLRIKQLIFSIDNSFPRDPPFTIPL